MEQWTRPFASAMRCRGSIKLDSIVSIVDTSRLAKETGGTVSEVSQRLEGNMPLTRSLTPCKRLLLLFHLQNAQMLSQTCHLPPSSPHQSRHQPGYHANRTTHCQDRLPRFLVQHQKQRANLQRFETQVGSPGLSTESFVSFSPLFCLPQPTHPCSRSTTSAAPTLRLSKEPHTCQRTPPQSPCTQASVWHRQRMCLDRLKSQQVH
jgi:hypothetical protein